ncbi:Sec-independent protein translocase protein TatB [Pseudomonas wenzhouensis]|uniref:Sec-independent protein translocase protein TatB n=1 Tax=Pseudomonas wenzhouensis TaxID=2906062 RepID=UPI001E5BC560|nr:Sec-independent protein translocase protein TatB [Pseudomonas wenzhouensis]UFQ98136.1 Sec-independent protein translocase subunit TatB [Pseudomonas wenzhouensis]
MFEIGFSELLLVGLVALVVLGPERLPEAVRTAGLWIGRIKRSFNSIKAEVEREIGADEIRRQLHNERILELEREMKAMKQDILDTANLKPGSHDDKTGVEPPAPAAQDKNPQP